MHNTLGVPDGNTTRGTPEPLSTRKVGIIYILAEQALHEEVQHA